MKRFNTILLLGGLFGLVQSAPYYGTKIGRFKTFYHEVVGDVYAVDDKTLFIKDFTYDGAGPDAFFWAGNTNKPDTTGTIIPDEKGQTKPLSAYKNKDLVLRLPEGKTIADFKWLSVWCRKFRANFGEISIPKTLEIPQPVEIGELSRLQHDVSSGLITMMDAQTFLVRDFTYDGQGPAAFWWVSRGPNQNARGVHLLDENGSEAKLRKYAGETVIIQLPPDKSYLDFDFFGVWCEEFKADFGNVPIPHDLKVPPSPRMLGLQVDTRNKLNCEVLHDEIGFELRWIMDGDQIILQMVGKVEPGEYLAFGLGKDDQKSDMINADSIVVWMDNNGRGHAVDYFLGTKEQCVGGRGSCPDVKTGGKESLSMISSSLVNGFTTITVRRPQAAQDETYDQHIYSDGPQAMMWAVGPINNRNEVSYHRLRTNGNIFIDFARPPKWNCPPPDTVEHSRQQPKPTKPPRTTPKPTTTTTPPPPPPPPPRTQHRRPEVTRNQQGRIPNQRLPKPQNQARPQVPRQQQLQPQPLPPTPRQPQRGFRNPPNPRGTVLTTPVPVYYQPDSQRTAASNPQGGWQIPAIVCPADRTFRFQIGPAGGKKGYQGITGKVGWGVAWYVNGYIVPELTVQRGRVYTFIVEGGRDDDQSAKHHPLYITSDPEGGYEFKDHNQRSKETIFAGIGRDRRGNNYPTAAGRLCEFKVPLSDPNPPEAYNTFEEFQQTLELKCEDGAPANLRWRPTKNTPDQVYYQCYTHRLLGWKIRVVDNCDEYEAQGSIVEFRNVTAPHAQSLNPSMDKKAFRKPNRQGVPNLFNGKKKPPPIFGQRKPKPTTITKPAINHRRPNPVKTTPPAGVVLDDGVLVAPTGHSNQARVIGTEEKQIIYPGSPGGLSQQGDFFLIPVQQHFNLGPKGLPPIPSVSGTPPLSARPHDNSRSIFPPNFSSLGGNKRVYYHGGFIPVIYNNGTFHQNRMPDPTTPPPGFRRPFPFNLNESIPFQGTFKPGTPDFSGFTLPKHHVYQPRPEHQVLPIPITPQLVVRPSSIPFSDDSVTDNLSYPGKIPLAIPGSGIVLERVIPDPVTTTTTTTTTTESPIQPEPRPVAQPPHDNDEDEDRDFYPQSVNVEGTVESDQTGEDEPQQSQYVPWAMPNQGAWNRDIEEQTTQEESQDSVKETLEESTEQSVPIRSQTSTSVLSRETYLINPFTPSKEETNKTDYSILSHVMSLIAGQAQPPPPPKELARETREAKDHQEGHQGTDHDHSHHNHSHHSQPSKNQTTEGSDANQGASSYVSLLTMTALVATVLLASN